MRHVPVETLLAIQHHFHEVIRGRAPDLIVEHGVVLPDISQLLALGDGKAWLAIPGMYGGFSYWLEGDGQDTRLITESWSRVVEGSGERHEITMEGSKLVESGFV